MKRYLCAAALALFVTPSFAHVSLEVGEAAVGSSYKAVFRVPHGCNGRPTIAVRIQIPEGVISVKPQPKAGWTLEKFRGDYANAYDYFGASTSEGVRELVWGGGNLGDDEYDEFILRGYLTPDLGVGSTIYFPVVQECAGGAVDRWIEIPSEGQTSDDLEFPAPSLKLLEKGSGH